MAKVRAKNSSKAKSTRKFAQSGQLDKQIKERRARQQKKSQIDNRKALKQRASYGDKASTTATGSKNGNGKDGAAAVDGEDEDEDDEDLVDDEDDDQVMDEETLEALLADSDADEVTELEHDDDEDDHAQDGFDLEDLEGEEERHKVSLQALKDKDPEFYKYLEENDPALLGFGDDDEDDNEVDDDDDDEDLASTKKSKKGKEKAGKVKATVVNKELLATWQTQMLKQRSLKALRKLLIAFRTAASIEDEDEAISSSRSAQQQQQQKEVYTIPNALMFNKVVTAALKYTPLVLGYHVPVKEQANGKFKVPTQSKKYATAQRIVKNYFTSLHSLFSSLSSTSNASLLQLSITESGRLIPYLVGNRKISKQHIKHLLNYWATSNDDSIKLSAFLSLRTLALAGDASIFELVVKGTYLAIGQVSKNTTVFTLPSITLMKNSASSLFVNNNSNSTASSQAYQLAFSYIRQLAVTLRNSMKATPKSNSGGGANGGANGAGKGKGSGEQYRQVYSWQFVHSIDFWSLVLATACDTERETEQAKESELRPLIYPLVQLTLGVIRLVPTSRYFPLRFQLVTSLLRIVQRTGVYVPLAPVLLEIFDSSEFSGKPKGSSLKPLDWAYYIRAPAAYPKTRVYSDALADETIYLLLEFFASQSTSIAFPELSIPVTVTLRRHIKKTRNSKLSNGLKALVDRLESNAKWIEEKRANIDFSPQDREQIDSFLSGKGDDAATPLRSYLKLQRKVRDQRREVLEKSLAVDEDSEAEEGEEMDEDDE